MLTRRDFLRLGVLGGTAGVLPLGRIATFAAGDGQHRSAYSFGRSSSGSPMTSPFQVPLPIPPVLTPSQTDAEADYYDITMRAADVEILPGLTTTIWGYEGLYPGPTIRARQGRAVVVRQRNELEVDTTIHLHGAKVAPEHDGHPHDLIAPGQFRDYAYPNDQPGLTMWYHDHADQRTGPNIYRGLAGFYLLEGADEPGLDLPTGDFDVPLMIQDRLFDENGSLSYPGNVHGVLGDTLLVNGAVQPFFEVANRPYRLRLLNGSNFREYDLTLSPALPLVQIAGDGGLLPAPVPRSNIRITPAERVEVVVDFSQQDIGSRLVLVDALGGGARPVMAFEVVRGEGGGPAPVPDTLRPAEQLGEPSATRNFDLSFDFVRDAWVINDAGFNANRIDARPRLGETEVWQFTNRSGMMHPMHLHLVQFQVLSRNGAAPPDYESGPKDTVAVQPNEIVQILARFSGFTGRYVFHCHRLEHEDRDMMGQFEVVG